MRIIGGELRSRRLLAPRDDTVTRPVPDRVKVSLFGLLRAHCEGATVFDAFAGTGSLGLEALSRGAERCVFIERSREAADLLRRNIETLGVQERSEIVVADALGPGALARAPRPLSLAFLDPPYALVRDPLGWKRTRAQAEALVALLAPDGFLVLRTPWPFLLEEPGGSAIAPAPAAPRRRERRTRERPSPWREREPEAQEPDAPPPPPPQPAPLTPADLSLAGADGPETHAYHTTALHLYMRKKA